MKAKTKITHNVSLNPKEFAMLVSLIRKACDNTRKIEASSEELVFASEYLKNFGLTLDIPQNTAKYEKPKQHGHPPVD